MEGENGADAMVFNGANIAENIDLSANGNRLRFFRNIGSITMDTAGVERIDVATLGGADLVTVNDLTGTDVGKGILEVVGDAALAARTAATGSPIRSCSTAPSTTTSSA